MGFMIAHGVCVGCKSLFAFNPDKVPSLRVNGVREPICKACVECANPLRKAKGLEPIVALPGAYAPEEVA